MEPTVNSTAGTPATVPENSITPGPGGGLGGPTGPKVPIVPHPDAARHRHVPPPGPQAWAGLALPGLGHLLSRRYLDGAGLMALTGLTLWAAARLPHLPAQLKMPGQPQFLLHPWVALFSLVASVVLLWWTAYRFAAPRPLDLVQEKTSQWRIVRREFVKNRVGVLGLYLVLGLMLTALCTPLLARYHPDVIDVGPKLIGPTVDHLMGTDRFARDMFSRVLYGGRISLVIGFISVGLSITLGASVGAIAGFFGGAVDKGLMWVTDLLLALPKLVLLLAIIGFYRAAGAQNIFLIVVVLGLTGWMGVARIVRSQVLSLKEQDFIQAARALGLSDARIIFNHLLPNTMAPLIVYASLAIGGTILTEASLSFLGLGVPPPTSTWGSLVNDGRDYLRTAWWITFFPGLLIVLAVMSFNLLGDGLRDALDPKMRGRE